MHLCHRSTSSQYLAHSALRAPMRETKLAKNENIRNDRSHWKVSIANAHTIFSSYCFCSFHIQIALFFLRLHLNSLPTCRSCNIIFSSIPNCVFFLFLFFNIAVCQCYYFRDKVEQIYKFLHLLYLRECGCGIMNAFAFRISHVTNLNSNPFFLTHTHGLSLHSFSLRFILNDSKFK